MFILDSYHPDTVGEQGYDGPWLFSEAKRAPRAKSLENTGLTDNISKIKPGKVGVTSY